MPVEGMALPGPRSAAADYARCHGAAPTAGLSPWVSPYTLARRFAHTCYAKHGAGWHRMGYFLSDSARAAAGKEQRKLATVEAVALSAR